MLKFKTLLPKSITSWLFVSFPFLFFGIFPISQATAQEIIPITEDMIWADHAQVKITAPMMFDGVLLENTIFWNDDKAAPKEVVIPGTSIQGQLVIIDLKGLVQIDKISVYDTYGSNPVLDIYCSTDLFNPTKLPSIPLTKFKEWQGIAVNKICRYLYFGAPEGKVGGFGEIQIVGTYLEHDLEIAEVEPFTGKTLEKTWGINTHDYSHGKGHAEFGLQNTQEVNPLLNERTYAEYHKNYHNEVIPGEPVFGDVNWAGSIRPNHAKYIRDKGGVLMFSLVGNLDKFADTYPEELPKKNDLPWVYWDETKSYEENRKRLYNPQTWGPLRDEMVKIATALQEYDGTVILQAFNELDKLWRKPHHRLNAFMVAAAQSIIWDGHEGKYGKGVKDVAPNMQLAWISTAYNNLTYVKMAEQWFIANREDGEFCADILTTNAYSNSQDGLQHQKGAHGVPPENSVWLGQLKKYYQYSRHLGKEFALTEFGYDHSGLSKNSVVLEDTNFWNDIETYRDHNDQKAANQWYDYEFWPAWKEKLLRQQAAWDLRAFLSATPYADYLFKYHIRDNDVMGHKVRGTYSSSGISENHGSKKRKGLSLKPNGQALAKIIDQVGDYVPYKMEEDDGQIQLYLKKGEDIKIIRWQDAHNSMPVLFSD